MKDYDEALAFYVGVLGFELLEDTPMGGGKRWVRVRPLPAANGRGCDILFARAVGEPQVASVGNQTGGRVFVFLHTETFHADYERLKSKGVTFLGEPGARTMATWLSSKTSTATSSTSSVRCGGSGYARA